MATVTSRLLELLRNLKSDAVPKPPRPEYEKSDSSNVNGEPEMHHDHPRDTEEQSDEDDHEEIVFGEDDFIKDTKKKFKFPFKSKKNKDDDPKVPRGSKPEKNDKRGSINSVNTQATGAVFNVVNSTGVQFGSNHVYYMSGTKKQNGTSDDENQIQKDNLITLLMESDIEPNHKYIDFVSKNLGINWKSIFMSMGYLKGRIDTLVLENGITEARYQLLQDWVNNKDGATLGGLAVILWEEGERQIVKELSLIYKDNKK